MGQPTSTKRSVARPMTAALGAVFVIIFAFLVSATAAHAGTATKVITDDKQGLDQRPSACSGDLLPMAYFVINQVDTPSDAPASITVNFADGSSTVYPLLVVDGKAAKYQGPVPVGSYATSATAVIYDAWSGEFVLSHYLCGTTPPTTDPTTTSSSTSTSTSSSTDPTTSSTDATTTTKGSSGGTSATTGSGGSGSSTPTDHLGAAKAAKAAAQSHHPLAFTGSNLASLVWIALAAIAAGLLLLTVKRNRAHHGLR